MIAALRNAIAKRDVSKIRELAKEYPIADLAEALEGLTAPEIIIFFRLLKTETQAEIFSFLEPEYQEQLVRSFTNEQIDDVIGELRAHEIADLIEEMPAELQTRIITSINDKETREKVNRLLRFEDDQIGSIMNVDFIVLSAKQTIANAMAAIRKERSKAALSHRFFVVNHDKKLVGQVLLEDLAFASPRGVVSRYLSPAPFIYMNDTKEEAAQEFAKHDQSILPVVNQNKELVGVITSDDMIDVVTEIATEDALKGAGVGATDKAYSKTSVWRLFRSRIF